VNVHHLSPPPECVKELRDVADVRISHELVLEAIQEGQSHAEEGQPAIHEEAIEKHHYSWVLEEATEECHDPLACDYLMTQADYLLEMIVQLRYIGPEESL